MTRLLALLSLAVPLAACGVARGVGDDAPPGPAGGPGPDGGPADDDCPRMYRQDVLPTYELTLAPAEWQALEDEFRNRPQREAMGLDPKPYHPADFVYLDGAERIEVPNVRVRLKGNSSWAQTIAFDANPKMQFVISFNEVDPDARFLGVRKLELDMPRTDHTFVRQRLALKALRQMGVAAQCANNARLVINGQYYGLYTNLERFDKEFIQRQFGEDDEGDLWEGGRIIQNNEDTFTWDRIDALWAANTVAEIDALADLDASIKVWAAEMMVGDVDGYGNGFANWYLYDHPTRDFVWLPIDLDTTFDPDFLPADSSPVFAPSPWRWELDWHHYRVVMTDPAGFNRFAGALGEVRSRFDGAALQRDLDAMAAQVRSAADADPRKPFTMAQHDFAVGASRQYITARATAIDAWLDCRSSGGPDRDSDGFDLCHDCDERAPMVNPGRGEVCNMVDDNCNGLLNDMPAGQVCQ